MTFYFDFEGQFISKAKMSFGGTMLSNVIGLAFCERRLYWYAGFFFFFKDH